MFKNRFWQLATILVSGYLMLALFPEVRLLGFLTLSLGLDTLILMVGLQVIAVWGAVYRQQLLPTAKRLNGFLEKHDPFYFLPSLQLIKNFPQMVIHAVPFLLTGYVMLFSAEVINEA